MVVNKRRKNVKMRGSKTHGWGAMKKHRGAGHRGGRGAAGSGKRADAKKPSIWGGRYFGKFGFKNNRRIVYATVNLSYLDENAEKLASEKLISKEKDVYVVDISKLGFGKLLGTGKVSSKFKITAPLASNSAIEKIKAAGGEVIGAEPEEKE